MEVVKTNFNVEVRQSKFGLGLFANQSLERGTFVLNISGQEISKSEAISLGNQLECYPIQIEINKYINPLPNNVWHFANHSCNPNCGITGDMNLITIKKINCGEELFFDYSTTMLERLWTMQCGCNSTNCRKLIEDFDKLPIDIQDNYLSQNIVQKFICNFLDGNN